MSNVKMSDVIMSAVELVLSRGGDVMTEDGDFATCGTDEIIRLDMAIAEFLGLPSDDVDIRDIDLILAKAKDYDGNQELNNAPYVSYFEISRATNRNKSQRESK